MGHAEGLPRQIPYHEMPRPTYQVRRGDTLYGIAVRFRTTVPILQKLNPDVDARDLAIGSQLMLPGGKAAFRHVQVQPSSGPSPRKQK